ncbi:MAG: hypothetical protein QXT53_02785 [Ignisphaera sp.]
MFSALEFAVKLFGIEAFDVAVPVTIFAIGIALLTMTIAKPSERKQEID